MATDSSNESEDDEVDYSKIVIDNGSGTIKAGFGGDDAPRYISSTLYKHNQIRPIQRGLITDWDTMVSLYQNSL